MNWEAVGAFAEAIGAIAVVATLIYLAAQIRQNTTALKGQTRASITQSSIDHLSMPIVPEKLASALLRQRNSDELTPEDHVQLTRYYHGQLRRWENVHYQASIGLFDTAHYQANLEIWSHALEDPYLVRVWGSERDRFSMNFRKDIDSLINQGEGGV